MTNFAASPPPPPPLPAMSSGPAAKAGPTGWVGVVAGVIGLLALVLPWYTPKVKVNGTTHNLDTSFHAWNGFFFLLIAPALLIGGGVLWFQAMRGQHNTRFAGSADPVRSVSLQSIAYGAVSIVLALLSIPILTATYKFKTDAGTISWSKASSQVKAAGGSLSRGPQIGLYLVLLGALVLIVTGVLGIFTKPAAAKAATPGPLGGQQFGGQQFGGQPADTQFGGPQGGPRFGGPPAAGPQSGGPQFGGPPPGTGPAGPR